MSFEQEIIELAQRFELDVPVLSGKLSCAIVGEWNAGKSALLNSLMGAQLLPEGVTETTRTVVRLSKSNDIEPAATVYDAQGSHSSFTGLAAVEALLQAKQDIPSIDFISPTLDLPPRTQFIDTPGINSDNQRVSSKAESVNADIIVFVLQAIGASLNQTQINFIQQMLLTKADLKDFFFVLTHADLLEGDNRQQVEERFGIQQIPRDRLFFISNKTQEGIAEFKHSLYAYLETREADLLEQRRRKYLKQATEALRQKAATERAIIAHHKQQSAEQRSALLEKIQEAKEQERRKKYELRNRSRDRLNDALRHLRETMDGIDNELEHLIASSSVEQLQKKGYLQNVLENALQTRFAPVMQSRLEQLLKDIQADVDEAGRFSSALVKDLELSLPTYNSPMTRMTAENILPLATLGCIMVMGWFSIPTLLLGYMTLKSRELGLTRYADQVGLLDSAIDKVKDWAASGYRQTLKMTVANTLIDYVNRISDHYRDTVEKATDKALQSVRYAEDLEKSLQSLRDESALIEREILLDKAEYLLSAYQP